MIKLFAIGDDPHRIRLKYLEREVERSSKAILALKERASSLHVEVSRRQTDSSQSDFDFSGDLSERTSGTTPYTYQGTTYQASGLDFAEMGTSGWLTNDDATTTTAMDSGSDSDLELEIYSDIACVLPKTFVFLFS